MISNLSIREKKILLLLFTFFLFIIFVQFMTKFALPTYASVKQDLNLKQQELVKAHSLAEKIEHLNVKKEELNLQLSKLLNRFQINLEADYPLAYLDNKELDLKLDSINLYPIKKSEYYSNLQIDMKLSGTYLSFLAYLEKIEKLPAVVEVVSPNITVKEDGLVYCDFTLNIYSVNMTPILTNLTNKELGKIDLFTPLVQVLTSVDVNTDLEPEASKIVEDVLSRDDKLDANLLLTEQDEAEKEESQECNINYSFPSR